MMKLDTTRAEIDGWLGQVKLKTGKCSGLLRDQLAERMRRRTIDVFAVYDEIGQTEGSDPPRRASRPDGYLIRFSAYIGERRPGLTR